MGGLERCCCRKLKRGLLTLICDRSAILQLCSNMRCAYSSIFSLSDLITVVHCSTRHNILVLSLQLHGSLFQIHKRTCRATSVYTNSNDSNSFKWAWAFLLSSTGHPSLYSSYSLFPYKITSHMPNKTGWHKENRSQPSMFSTRVMHTFRRGDLHDVPWMVFW